MRHAHVLVAGARGLLGIRAQRVDVGRRVVEPDRPREVEHVVDDAVEPRDLFVDVGQRLLHFVAAHALAARASAATP